MEHYVLFLCVRNRVRSVFAEFYFKKMLKDQRGHLAEHVKISSAGFFPKKLKDLLAAENVPLPEPLYGMDMTGIVRELLHEQGIALPARWRSKAMIPEEISKADLILVAAPWLKEEISTDYPEVSEKIFTFREIAAWEDNILGETLEGLPIDDRFWYACEEEPLYATRQLGDVERLMKSAFPHIMDHLGIQ